MKWNTSQVLILLIVLLCMPAHGVAYDSDNNGTDNLADAIISLNEFRLKETIHTLQVLTGKNPSPDLYFSRSMNGHLVTDLSEGLMWQDYSLAFKTEEQGIAYCDDSLLDGYDDWRLPAFLELQTFFKSVDKDNSFDLNFWGTFSYCTASVAIGGYVKTPYGAEVYGGEVGDRIYFSGGAAARCVRSAL